MIRHCNDLIYWNEKNQDLAAILIKLIFSRIKIIFHYECSIRVVLTALLEWLSLIKFTVARLPYFHLFHICDRACKNRACMHKLHSVT